MGLYSINTVLLLKHHPIKLKTWDDASAQLDTAPCNGCVFLQFPIESQSKLKQMQCYSGYAVYLFHNQGLMALCITLVADWPLDNSACTMRELKQWSGAAQRNIYSKEGVPASPQNKYADCTIMKDQLMHTRAAGSCPFRTRRSWVSDPVWLTVKGCEWAWSHSIINI